MKNLCRFMLSLLVLPFFAGTVQADERSETRPLDARVNRVKIDGVIDLKLRQGSVASLTISADAGIVTQVTSVQSGDTLHIETNGRGFKSGRSSARAELVLPALRAVSSDGVGSCEISGFNGEQLELILEGAGSMRVVGNYRIVQASLGGVGSMNLFFSDNDSIALNLNGAGHINLAGRGKLLKANLGGLGGLDARQFEALAVDLDLSGLGNASVNVQERLKVDLTGMGSVMVYGKPQTRNVSVDGLGKVSWR